MLMGMELMMGMGSQQQSEAGELAAGHLHLYSSCDLRF